MQTVSNQCPSFGNEYFSWKNNKSTLMFPGIFLNEILRLIYNKRDLMRKNTLFFWKGVLRKDCSKNKINRKNIL
jgi:hypothetical protein